MIRWFQRDRREPETVTGRTGRVSGSVGPGLVGEVVLPIRGGSEAFIAYPFLPGESFPTGSMVVVVEYSEPRTVYVSAAS